MADRYLDADYCIKSGKHLTNCDDDGFCNFCGEQAEGDSSCQGPVVCLHCSSQIGVHSDYSEQDPSTSIPRRYVLELLRGFLAYIEDGNVVELRPCGFREELASELKKLAAEERRCEVCSQSEVTVGELSSNHKHDLICEDCLSEDL